jgi:F-type H+-transporting ATPase subunit b
MKRLILLVLMTGATLAAQEAQGGGSAEPSMTWKVVNFAILAIGLGYLMVKTLPGFFHSRTSSIQEGIAEAQKVKADAERRAAEVDKRVSALGADIENFRAQSRAEMEKEGGRIRQETAATIQKLEQQAQVEIESAGKTARRELKAYAANLALDLAEQRVRARLDAGTEDGLVENFVLDLKRQESQN